MIVESWDILSQKGPLRISESNSTQVNPKIQAIWLRAQSKRFLNTATVLFNTLIQIFFIRNNFIRGIYFVLMV